MLVLPADPVEIMLRSFPSITVKSPGHETLVIAAPASWKSLVPFPSASIPLETGTPSTLPSALIVGSTPPNIPSLLESLSVSVPKYSSTS